MSRPGPCRHETSQACGRPPRALASDSQGACWSTHVVFGLSYFILARMLMTHVTRLLTRCLTRVLTRLLTCLLTRLTRLLTRWLTCLMTRVMQHTCCSSRLEPRADPRVARPTNHFRVNLCWQQGAAVCYVRKDGCLTYCSGARAVFAGDHFSLLSVFT